VVCFLTYLQTTGVQDVSSVVVASVCCQISTIRPSYITCQMASKVVAVVATAA